MFRTRILLSPLRPEGRDITKFRKDGFYRGTQANTARFIFVGSGLLVGILFGVYACFHKESRFERYFMGSILELDNRLHQHQQKVKELEAEQVMRNRQKLSDDDI